MSIDALNWCRNLRGLPPMQKSVLLYICDRYNDDRCYAWPSIKTISRDTSWSERTVTRALRWLEQRDYIATYRQVYMHDYRPGSNRYYLPSFTEIPKPGKVFWIGGDFDHTGTWQSDLTSTDEELSQWYGQPDTPW